MSNLTFIEESEVAKYDFLLDFVELEKVEQVCTLVHTFREATKNVSFRSIKSVKTDSEGHFFFILGVDGEFDLFNFIYDNFDVDCVLTCMNIAKVFPERLSIGLYQQENIEDTEIEEGATEYMDSEDEEFDLAILLKMPERAVTDIPLGGINIGRSPSKSQLVVNNNSVGRLHCNVYYVGKELYVHDYASLNGTFVNDYKVSETRDTQLKKGDKLRVANEIFEVL